MMRRRGHCLRGRRLCTSQRVSIFNPSSQLPTRTPHRHKTRDCTTPTSTSTCAKEVGAFLTNRTMALYEPPSIHHRQDMMVKLPAAMVLATSASPRRTPCTTTATAPAPTCMSQSNPFQDLPCPRKIPRTPSVDQTRPRLRSNLWTRKESRRGFKPGWCGRRGMRRCGGSSTWLAGAAAPTTTHRWCSWCRARCASASSRGPCCFRQIWCRRRTRRLRRRGRDASGPWRSRWRPWLPQRTPGACRSASRVTTAPSQDISWQTCAGSLRRAEVRRMPSTRSAWGLGVASAGPAPCCSSTSRAMP
mmetsp:Transcript_25071/g.62717  ORF Transcript_25071/g.62717 Transcript_25071/m.62717 type:complete len:303 (-) Transcript_25071:938-1846(-)